MKNYLYKSGSIRLYNNKERYSVVNEAFSAAKEVKISNLENNYINRFSIPAQLYAKSQSVAEIIGQLPRYFIEGVAFGGMIILGAVSNFWQ